MCFIMVRKSFQLGRILPSETSSRSKYFVVFSLPGVGSGKKRHRDESSTVRPEEAVPMALSIATLSKVAPLTSVKTSCVSLEPRRKPACISVLLTMVSRPERHTTRRPPADIFVPSGNVHLPRTFPLSVRPYPLMSISVSLIFLSSAQGWRSPKLSIRED